MPNLYEELMSNINITKTASTNSVKEGISNLDTNELVRLAAELAELTGDSELAEMAKILPVYASGASHSEKAIEVEQGIKNVNPDVAAEALLGNEEILASENTDGEKPEEDKKEEKPEEDKKEEKPEEDKKEEKPEEDKNEEEKSAAQTLYEILKEGAAFEELIEVRASQLVESMIKEAEEAEVARQITDATAVSLTENPMKAYEYSQQMMEKAKTVAAQNDVPLSEAAQAVAKDVVATVGTVSKQASTADPFSRLSELSKTASDLENSYEKIAQEVGEIAEAIILDAGTKQGLDGANLHEFIQKNMEHVKTLAAKKNINLAQAAQEYLAGETGAVAGVIEPIVPSPSQVPSEAKAPINSNQTQSPDQYFEQMVAPADPGLQAEPSAEEKAAAINEFVKEIMKQAMTNGLNK